MKYIFLLLFFIIPLCGKGQKILVNFTKEQIQDINLSQFGTSNWEQRVVEKFDVLGTLSRSCDLKTDYFFFQGEGRNFACGHSTKDSQIAGTLLDQIVWGWIYIGNFRYQNSEGVIVEYDFDPSTRLHTFIYTKD